MYCKKCGKEIKDSSKFCPYCGEYAFDNSQRELQKKVNGQEENFSKCKKSTYAIVILVIVTIMICAMAYKVSNYSAKKYLNVGNKYMEEQSYNEAAASYKKAIEKNNAYVEAYVALVDLYIDVEEYDEIKVLLSTVPKKIKNRKDIASIMTTDADNRVVISDQNGKIRYTKGKYTKRIYNEEEKLVKIYDVYLGKDRLLLEYDDEEECYKIYNEEIEDLPRCDTYQYDNAGNMVKWCRYYECGKQEFCCLNEYNNAGNLIKCYSYEGENLRDSHTNEYDDFGNKIKEIWYDEFGESLGYDTYEYDNAGNETKNNSYNDTGELVSYEICEYDNSGNMIKSSSYHETGEMICCSTYKYEFDSFGNIIKKDIYDEQSEYVFSTEYEYGHLKDRAVYEVVNGRHSIYME